MSENSSVLTNPKDQTVIDRAIDLLTNQYIPYVKEAIIWLESHTGKRSERAIHELKNALDHMAIALHRETTKEDAMRSLTAVEEHFRRAAVEPAEWIALEKLRILLKIKLKGFWWWRFFLLKPPNSKEFNEEIYKGQDFIAQGRHFKGISLKDSYDNFKRAYLLLNGLLETIQPTELYSRIFTVIVALIGLILGISGTVIVSFLL